MPQDKSQGQRRPQRPLQGWKTQPQKVACEGLAPGETTDIVLRLHVATAAHGPTEQGRNARLWAKSATTVVGSDIFQKYVGRGQTIKIVKRLQSNT